MLRPRVLGSALLGLVALAAGAVAQETAQRLALGGGAVLFERVGTDSPDGLGLFLRGTGRIARFGSNSALTVELTFSQYAFSGQVCPAVPGPLLPGGCERTGPPASVWSARVGLSLAHRPPSPLLLFGLGGYSNINKASGPSQPAVGLDLGLGVALSPRLALDARFVWLRSSRTHAWSTPVGVSVWL